MDYTPEPHYLRSKMTENLSWHDAIAEIIDNAFDANANRCEIEFKAKTVITRDDGIGSDKLQHFVCLGGRQDHSTTSVGMHGRGLKDAWLWLGDEIRIASNHRGNKHTLTLNVMDLEKNKWEGPDPCSEPSQDKGTTIEFPAIRHTAPRDSSFDKLEKTFMPALKDGRQILIRLHGKPTRRLRPHCVPELDDVVEETFICGGREVSFRIGIVPADAVNTTKGFLYIFGHRMIMESYLGCGDTPSSRITGTVTLAKGWKLSPHKNNIAEGSEELGDAIADRIQSILLKAKEQHINAETEAFESELDSLMQKGVEGLKKEARAAAENATGGRIPKYTGRRRKAAKKKHDAPGSVVVEIVPPPKKRKGLKIVTYTDKSADVLGEADNAANIVKLNLTHPIVNIAWQDRNLCAVYAIAFGVYCFSRSQDSQGGDVEYSTMFDIHDFPSAWAIALRTGKFQGGLPDEKLS